MSKPLLTIGIIFKDNIRSIERCLSALQPLRDAVPCELILADTGSSDGSREVAERYADTLFDFPWIGDFSAARNAVMDRASGKWFLTVDSDEYLDENVAGLKKFVAKAPKQINAGIVMQRNYQSYEMDDNYNDFPAVRLLRMSTGIRYHGKIHESWGRMGSKLISAICPGAILHHDGYVELAKPGSEKRKRNVELLREKVKNEPDNLLGWLQLIESGGTEPDYWDIVEQAVALVEQKKPMWEEIGPPILRHAAVSAVRRNLPEAEEWIERAETMFPDSLFTRVDVQYTVCSRLWQKKDTAGLIPRGEEYLRAINDYRSYKDVCGRGLSAFQATSPVKERDIRLYLASSCTKECQPERGLELLRSIEIEKLNAGQVEEFIIALREIQGKSFLDTAPLLDAAWESVNDPESDVERRKAFLRPCGAAFARENRENEVLSLGFCRPYYTMLLALKDKCELGRAAAILEEKDPRVMAKKLSQVERWDEFPIHALSWALEQGAPFPPTGKEFRREELETLVSRLASDRESILALARKAMEGDLPKSLRDLFWKQELVLAAIRVYPWDVEERDEGQCMAFARGFAMLEGAYLPRFYAPDILSEESISLLPPLHRLGWYCFQAFSALDEGNTVRYTQMLRNGLPAYEVARPMIEFLTQHTPQLLQTPSAEMQALAEQIRSILANFAPDDVAVVALKQSEAYQKVAYLIEGVEAPVIGGMLQ